MNPPANPSDLEDDRGNRFAGDELAPLPEGLARLVARGPLTDAHILLVFGFFLLIFGALALAHPLPPSPPSYRRRGSPIFWMIAGAASIAGAGLRYAGLGSRPRADRRVLLKRGLCPVCLAPLDKRGASGETIACSCGAVWERRFM
jgi:hypothetical protein